MNQAVSPDAQPTSRRPVLVIEDSAELQQLIGSLLEREGFDVHLTASGQKGIDHARRTHPELIILDLRLPDLDGLEVCRRLRRFTDAYIIIVSGLDSEVHRVMGLTAGADDYLCKPFAVRELLARIQAVLRRPRSGPTLREPVRRFGDLEIDPRSREVRLDGEEVSLTRLEFGLLEMLTRVPESVVSREDLFVAAWGEAWVGNGHIVDVHISNLRRKIDSGSASWVKTVRGVGYRFNLQAGLLAAD